MDYTDIAHIIFQHSKRRILRPAAKGSGHQNQLCFGAGTDALRVFYDLQKI